MSDRENKGFFGTLKDSVGGEAIRNWVVDLLVEYGIGQYKTDPTTGQLREGYLQLMYNLQHYPHEGRAMIIGAAQVVHSAYHAIPFDKIPLISALPNRQAIVDFIHDNLKASLEQLPDTMRAYAAEQKIDFPADFKPKTFKESIEGYFAWMAEHIKSAPASVLEHLSSTTPKIRDFINSFVNQLPLPFSGRDNTHRGSFHQYRMAFLNMSSVQREQEVTSFWGPADPKQEDVPLTEQDRWNHQQSHKYLNTRQLRAKFARLSRRHQRYFLSMTDHDDWFNFLSPKLKENLSQAMESVNQIIRGVKPLVDMANTKLEARQQRRRAVNIRNRWILGLSIGAIVAILWFTSLPDYQKWIIGSVIFVAVGISLLIFNHNQNRGEVNG